MDDDLYDPSSDLFGPDDSSFDAQLAAVDLPGPVPGPSTLRPSRNNRDEGNSGTWRNKRRRVSNFGPQEAIEEVEELSEEDVDERYNDGEEYEAISFGQFGRYMRNKRKKLHVQEQALRDRQREKKPQIFKGLSIHVNGHTDIPLAKLRELIVLRGGTYMAYLDHKTSITHIIATSLTPKKREEFRRYKIAKPEWITESVAAGRLLRWHDFGLITQPGAGVMDIASGDSVAGVATTQRTLASMGMSQAPKPSTFGAAKPPPTARKSLEAQVRAANAPPPAETSKSASGDPTTPQEERVPSHGGTDPGTPGFVPRSRSPQRAALLRDQAWIAEHTAIAPDFIEGYYKQSRLHHLSTWKAQLLKDIGELLEARKVEKTKEKEKARPRKLKGDASDGRTIFHVDFDCFFTTASLLARPGLKGKPVCVCHAKGSGKGGESSTSEIASCSYEARTFGVKNGMALGRARELCPGIQTIPYDFELYSKISLQFYQILLSHADDLQAVSVDECLIDVSTQCIPALQVDSPPFKGEDTAITLAKKIRQEILDTTKCEASVGISHNILLARLATRRAKPANVFHLLPSGVDEHLAGLDIEDLPGVGWHQRGKIETALKTTNVGDLRAMLLARVQDSLGPNWGRIVHQYAKGIDARELKGAQERKSVAAEINYGIRFEPAPEGLAHAERFVRGMGQEVSRRLKDVNFKGRHLTLHVMRKAADAGDETWKFLGHGDCDRISKNARIAGPRDTATDDGDIIAETAWRMMLALEISLEELRGIGIQIQQLESAEASTGQALLPFKPQPAKTSEEKTFKPFVPKKRVAFLDMALGFEAKPAGEPDKAEQAPRETHEPVQAPASALAPAPAHVAATQIHIPPMSQIDVDALNSLPQGLQEQVKAAMVVKAGESSKPVTRSKGKEQKVEFGLPSASQIDPSVLEELPAEVRAELETAYRQVAPLSAPSPPLPKISPKNPPAKVKKPAATITAHFGGAKRPNTRPSKRFKGVAFDLKQMVIAEGSQALKVAVRPAPAQARSLTLALDPMRMKDSELEALGIEDVEFFRGLHDRALQLDILSIQCAERPEVLQKLRGINDARYGANGGINGTAADNAVAPLEVVVAPLPVIMKRSTTVEVCDLIDRWVEGYCDEGPDRQDVISMRTFLLECVDRKRGSGQDLCKAVEIVEWWTMALDLQGGKMVPGVRRQWDTAVRAVKQKVNEVAVADHGAPLFA